MRPKPERYLEHARDCEQHAVNAKAPEAAPKFLEAAEAWRQLAHRAQNANSLQGASENAKG